MSTYTQLTQSGRLFRSVRSVAIAVQTRWVIFFLCLSGGSFGYQVPSDPQEASKGNPRFQVQASLGRACIECHRKKDANQTELIQASLYLGTPVAQGQRALDADVHALAVGKIWNSNGSLTKAFEDIVNNLQWKAGSNDVQTKCLTCHAGLQTNESNGLGRPLSEILVDRSTTFADAIGCEACHGRGDKYENLHVQANWLAQSASFKKGFGFYDLENSAIAAEVCMSCHLGNRAQSKFVTHDMYAAGHPPLPPFDLAKFLEGTCAKHWKDLDEKSAAWAASPSSSDGIRREYLLQHFRFDAAADSKPDESPSLLLMDESIQSHFRKTQQSLVGQIVSSIVSHDLMFQGATQEAQWGDYANYDCVGCHQTLYKSLRSSFNPSGRVPGRPQRSRWTELDPGLVSLGFPSELLPSQKLVESNLNLKPFGSADGIQAALATYPALRESVWDQIELQARTPLRLDQAKSWMRSYLAVKQQSLGNEWVAKQVFWTLEAYFDDLAEFTSRHPDISQDTSDLKTKFRELAALAPPVSRMVSCDPQQHGLRDGVDDTMFYQQIQLFVDEFLGQ